MVREALFSILASRIAGAVFVDLFAGSGAIGIEALSRGAGKVIFIDSNQGCGALIRENLKLLGASGRDALVLDIDLSRSAAQKALRGCLKLAGEAAADVVYADPPYDYGDMENLPRLISESCLCAPDGIFVFEHGKMRDAPQIAGAFEKYSERQYGDSRLSFYKSASDIFMG